MGFRINTNIAAMNAHTNATMTNRDMEKSLSRLSSGLRINTAADDASGLVIADSLRSQANSLGQAVANANDAIGIIQTADKAMDEQLKILDTIKTKAIQAATDGQSASSREAIQKDVNRLLEELDNIALTTTFNGQTLLSGQFENKEFQIGAYTNQTIKASIQNTESLVIGDVQRVSDSSQLGNVVSVDVAAAKGDTTLTLSDVKGLAKGDIIQFEGSSNTYAVQDVVSSSGTVELAVPLTEDIALGTRMQMDTAAANPSGYLELDTAFTAGNSEASFDFSQMRGLAVGDVLTFVNSLGTESDMTVALVNSSGDVSFGADTFVSGGAAANSRVYLKSSAATLATPTINSALGISGQTISMGSAANAQGFAVGDVVQISGGTDEIQQFVINAINSVGDISLGTSSAFGFSAGSSITLLTAADNLTHLAITGNLTSGTSTSIVLSDTNLDIRALAVGDTVTVKNSTGQTQDLVVNNINTSSGTATISFGGATIDISTAAGNGGIIISNSAALGTSLTSSDYVKYTVEGESVDGVLMTNSSGNGVADTGLGRVAELLNTISDKTGVTVKADVTKTATAQVAAGEISADMTINGVTILEAGTTLVAGDTDNRLIDAINEKTSETGVKASLVDGKLKLESDGRAISLSGFTTAASISDGVIAGHLTFTKDGNNPIEVTAEHFTDANLKTQAQNVSTTLDPDDAVTYRLSDLITGRVDDNKDGLINSNDVTGLMRTFEGAMLAMDIVEKATLDLDTRRADMGSVQNELVVTVNNISATQVNVKAAESQIRDVDFAAESANFSKLNILAQSGSYAMSQANAVQQNVLRLLQ